jgi:hypothetical protein
MYGQQITRYSTGSLADLDERKKGCLVLCRMQDGSGIGKGKENQHESCCARQNMRRQLVISLTGAFLCLSQDYGYTWMLARYLAPYIL